MQTSVSPLLAVTLIAGLTISCGKSNSEDDQAPSAGQQQQQQAPASSANLDSQAPLNIDQMVKVLQAAPKEKKNWDTLKVSVPQYLEKNPDSLKAQAILGVVKAHFGEHVEAKKLFKAVQVKQPNHEFVILGLAGIELKQKNWQEVINIVKPGLKENPESENLHALAATAYAGLGKNLESRAHFDRVNAINPSYSGIPVSGGFEGFVTWISDHKEELTNVMDITVKVIATIGIIVGLL